MVATVRVPPEDKPLVIFVGGFCDSIVKAMQRFYHSYEQPGQVKAYSSHLMGGAIAEQIALWKDKTGQPVVLIGHSYGGDTVVRVAEQLARRRSDQPIDLLVTVDPVSRRGGVPRQPVTAAGRWFNSRVGDARKNLSRPNIVALIGGHWPPLLPLGLVEREHEIHAPHDHVHVDVMMEPFMDEVRSFR